MKKSEKKIKINLYQSCSDLRLSLDGRFDHNFSNVRVLMCARACAGSRGLRIVVEKTGIYVIAKETFSDYHSSSRKSREGDDAADT